MSCANPLIKVLEDATSQNPRILKDAEEQLKAWEQQPNFYQAILNVCYDYNISSQVRWFASLYFKNGIDKYWRRSGPLNRVISDEDKSEIRRKLITIFHEPVYQISVQLAVVIGRIARTDLRCWPDLVPKLLQEVKSSERLVQQNALLTLNHVIKGLMSKRLVTDRKIFKEVSSGIFAFILKLYVYHLNLLIHYFSKEQSISIEDAEYSLKMSILSLKVLRKLTVEGYDSNSNAGNHNLLQMLVERMPFLINQRAENVAISMISDKMQSLITNGMKVLLETQERHPLLFANVLENALKLIIDSVFEYSVKDVLFDAFIVQCCNLLRGIIKCNEYKIKKEPQIEDNVSTTSLEAQKIIQDVLSPDAIRNLCRQLILRYFPLTTQEFNEWENDPEGYLLEEAGDSDNCLIRPCSETLFLSFYYQFRENFTAVTSELLHSVNGSSPNESSENLIKKEAVYFALGLASYELFGDLNFDQFFQEFLIKELQNNSPSFRIIRRRILWLIGRWINVSFTSESRIVLYQILTEVLGESEDLVVRITASGTLKDAVDDYQFKKEDFLPYLARVWDRLFRLLVDVHQSETKMTVLSVISIVIERVGSQIRPLSASLCEYLPRLWVDSEEHNMLRSLVITTLSHLVKALGADSMQIHSFLLPIIHFSTDLKQAAHVYLLDDGLELWLEVMENAYAMTEDLLAAFEVLPIILEQVSENFRTCVAIMKAYILLDTVSVLQIHSASLVRVIGSLIGQMKTEGNILIAELMEDVCIALPCDGPAVFESTMVDLFKIVIADEEYPQVLISYLTLFGYTILNNIAIFNQVLQKACEGQLERVEEIAGRFIDIWLDKVDCMTKDEARKLTTMALVSILPLDAKFVNDRFALILDTAVNVLFDNSKIISHEEHSEERHSQEPISSEESAEEEKMDEKRRKMLRSKNPVITSSLVEFVKHKVTETKNALGIERFQFLMETMDPVVGQQLFSLIN